ncbi:MAG: zinc ribbon domain-containing protein [Candidatus Omnitrophota bacterium]
MNRNQAGEITSVVKDAFNYVAKETRDGVKTIAHAVEEEIGAAAANTGKEAMVRCHKCNHDNSSRAKFCEECGAELSKSKSCGQSGELKEPEA